MTDDLRCRWQGSDRPRAIIGRHDWGCEDETCRGCEPCTRSHCRVCYAEHAAGACASCVGGVRDDLVRISELCGSLATEVEHRGVNGEAFNLLGPVADVEAWGHRSASILAGRIVPMDCDATEIDDVKAWLERADHERHPLWVLGTWQETYAAEFDHELPERIDVFNAAGYLGRNLTYAGDWPHVPFEDFAEDVRRSREHMERVLHADEQIERGAPCPECRKSLTMVYGKRVVDDRWRCLTRSCDVADYTRAQYRGWVEDDALFQAKALTANDMPRRFRDEDDRARVKPGEVRVWGSREKVRKRGTNDKGITLYDVADVEERIEARDAALECA